LEFIPEKLDPQTMQLKFDEATHLPLKAQDEFAELLTDIRLQTGIFKSEFM